MLSIPNLTEKIIRQIHQSALKFCCFRLVICDTMPLIRCKQISKSVKLLFGLETRLYWFCLSFQGS